MDPQTRPPPVEVPYAPPLPGATRGQMRLLLLLTFINTVLLGTYVLGPGLTAFARQQWADYQQHRARAAAEAQATAVRQSFLPAQQQCLDHLDPPGTLMYAEDPSGIALLTANGDAKHVGRTDGGVFQRPPELVPLPVGAADPRCAAGMPSTLTLPSTGGTVLPQPGATLLFLHERHTVAGPRLVVVSVASVQGSDSQANGEDHRVYNRLLSTRRELTATLARPATPTADAAVLFSKVTYLSVGSSLFTVDDSDHRHGTRVTADYAGLLRLYAGQPDPADPARFHIPYQLDAHRGTIDGQVTADDFIRLEPDRYLADREAAGEWSGNIPSPDERRATGKPR